jgi:hypothetical protein
MFLERLDHKETIEKYFSGIDCRQRNSHSAPGPLHRRTDQRDEFRKFLALLALFFQRNPILP